MDRNLVMSAWNKAMEVLKKGMGRASDDRKIEVKDRVDKAKGDVQNAVGGEKDSPRGNP